MPQDPDAAHTPKTEPATSALAVGPAAPTGAEGPQPAATTEPSSTLGPAEQAPSPSLPREPERGIPAGLPDDRTTAAAGPLAPFGPEIWIGEGPVVRFWFGFPYPTRMVVVRLSDGDLFVWSPIALTPELRQAVDALGPVRALVAPNLLHHLFLKEWADAYPQARLFAAPGLARRRKDLSFDAELTDTPDPLWAKDIDQVRMAGSFVMTEVVFFHRASGTAIFADLIENFPPGWFKGWRRLLARLDGILSPHPGAPREWRASFLDRAKARAALGHILSWPITRVVMAHGTLVPAEGRAFVARAFRWLIGDDGMPSN